MARHARKQSDIGFAAISVVGGLISPDKIAQIASVSPDAKTAESYSCPKGTSLRDEIARYFRIGQAEWQSFSKIENPTFEQCAAFAKCLLEEVFGFSNLQGPKTRRSDGHSFKISLEGKNGRVPIVVAPHSTDDDLDGFKVAYTAFGDAESGRTKRRPDALLQEWLNASEPALWGLVFAGDRVRLMRDNASFTRPAFIEADLGAIFRDEMFADFTALWLLIHATRFGNEGAAVTDCPLERWREEGVESGTAARDRLRENVEEALLSLGQGFLEGNPYLREKLDSGTLSDQRWFEQLLRVVYRLIFIAVTEERDLLHEPDVKPAIRKLYAEGYSFAHMRERSTRRTLRDPHADVWEGARILFRALDKGQARLGLPALGGIFDESLTQDLNEARLANKHFLNAIYRLSFIQDGKTRVRINWRDMATEELGSVYEGLLELVPTRTNHGRDFAFAGGDEARGNARKTSGSYYTPDSLVQALLDTALDPVLDRAEANGGVEAILNLTVIDPACGSAHFLLGAARRMAERVAKLRDSENPDFQHALRDVVRRCVYGVDRNPMAVELAKVALWIEAVEPGRPLGFLDKNIRCGDALLGVFDLKVLKEGIPDAAYKPLTGDDKDVAKYYERINKNEKIGQGTFDFSGGKSETPTAPLSAEFSDLRDLPEDTVKDVEAKAKAYRSLRKKDAFLRARMGCNLYTAAFLVPKTGEVPSGDSERTVPTSQDVWLAVGQGKGRKPIMENAKAATQARALHWPLEFPDIMGRGGFDLVLGNPPWEKIKLQEKEFFAARDAEIATAQNKAARDRLIKSLRDAEPGSNKRALFEEFEREKRLSEATSSFVRIKGDEGGRFPYTGTGDVNTYALFAELFSGVVSPSGRAGVIVPTGVATDATTAPFFAHLVDEKRLASLFDFENSAPAFTSVHRSFKFSLLTLGRNEPEARFAFFLTEPAQLLEPERNFTLSPEQIATINPNTKTAPVFRSRWDAELTAKMYRNSEVLLNEEAGSTGNPWGVSYMAMFHMSNDSALFRTGSQLEKAGFVRDGVDWTSAVMSPAQGELSVEGQEVGSLALVGGEPARQPRYIPLFEAKMLSHYDHRAASYGGRGDSRGYRVLPPTELSQHIDPDYEVEPFYWISEKDVVARLRDWKIPALLVFNKVTGIGNERTLFPTLIPPVGFGDSLNLLMTHEQVEKYAALYANLSSIILDFAVRRKVGGVNINFFHVNQFPVLAPDFYDKERLDFVKERVLELTYTSHSLAPFARDLGHDGPPFAWDEDRRALLRAELDAFYARAYILTRDELRYILDPADVKGEDYPSETFRVLKERENRQYGEYRTRRLVLEAWDRLEANGDFKAMEM